MQITGRLHTAKRSRRSLQRSFRPQQRNRCRRWFWFGQRDERGRDKELSFEHVRARLEKSHEGDSHSTLGLPISDTDVEKIKVGFRSGSMEDKWDMLIEDRDENGTISLQVLRNWLQEECYILYIARSQVTMIAGVQRSKALPEKGISRVTMRCRAGREGSRDFFPESSSTASLRRSRAIHPWCYGILVLKRSWTRNRLLAPKSHILITTRVIVGRNILHLHSSLRQ